MKTMRKRFNWLFGLAVLTSCTSSDLIKDPIVQRWCGERPCDWQADGEIKRVGTWHPDDYAVELVSDGATLSQLNANVDQRASQCFSFSMLADIDSSARVFLELDFLDDGVIDFSQRLPESHWDKRTFNITAPTWYHGVRFILRKDGPGHVALAELRAQDGQQSCSAPPIKLTNRPDGAGCESADECSSGTCASTRCGECSRDLDCDAGQICGEASLDAGIATRCLESAGGEFGHVCSRNLECASGICNDGACSECSAGAPCDGGASCARSKAAFSGSAYQWPTQCDPDHFSRKPGELCVDDEDCISKSCSGASKQCTDVHCNLGDDDAGVCAAFCQQWIVTGGTCL